MSLLLMHALPLVGDLWPAPEELYGCTCVCVQPSMHASPVWSEVSMPVS